MPSKSVLPRLLLCLSTIASLSAAVASASCRTNGDCEWLGTCEAGRCACLPGFKGSRCSSLHLLPTSAQASRLWPRGPLAPPTPVPSPTPPADDDFNTTAWGADVVFDESDGLWHAMVDVACGAKGVLAGGGAGSYIAHATSSEGPDRGFVLRAMATPTTSFGPHLSRDPVTRQFAMIFRVNALEPRAVCGGNDTQSHATAGPMPPAFSATPYIPREKLVADPTGEAGQNFYVATATRMSGPWDVRKVNVTGASAAAILSKPDVHISNNALFFPAPGSAARARGRVGMAFRYNPSGGEMVGYAVADSVDGPFVAISNLSVVAPKGSEDPFVFQLPTTTQPKTTEAESATRVVLHMIWHDGPHGYHAWSTDGGATFESNANAGVHFYEATVAYADNSSETFKRRERPGLLFDADTGFPSHLITGVQRLGGSAGGTAFSHIQPIARSDDDDDDDRRTTVGSTPRNVTYVHNFVGSDGLSHMIECPFSAWVSSVIEPGTPPMYTDQLFPGNITNVGDLTMAVLPVGWNADWHHDPKVQLVFFVSGRGTWRTESNDTRSFGPGDLYLGEDQLAKRGHTSFQVGEEPLVLALLPFTNAPTKNEPCWLGGGAE